MSFSKSTLSIFCRQVQVVTKCFSNILKFTSSIFLSFCHDISGQIYDKIVSIPFAVRRSNGWRRSNLFAFATLLYTLFELCYLVVQSIFNSFKDSCLSTHPLQLSSLEQHLIRNPKRKDLQIQTLILLKKIFDRRCQSKETFTETTKQVISILGTMLTNMIPFTNIHQLTLDEVIQKQNIILAIRISKNSGETSSKLSRTNPLTNLFGLISLSLLFFITFFVCVFMLCL